MKKEKTKEKPKVVFEDEFMTVFEDNGRRKVVFANEMRTKVDVEISAKTEGNPIFKFHTEDNAPIFVGSYDPLYVESAPSIIVDETTSLTVKEVKDVRVENFHGSLEAASKEQLVAVQLSSKGNLIFIPDNDLLVVDLLGNDNTGKTRFAEASLSFDKIANDKYCCNVRSNFELNVSNTPKVVLLDAFDGQPIVLEEVDEKNAGYFEHITGPFGAIRKSECSTEREIIYEISSEENLKIIPKQSVSVHTDGVEFLYRIYNGVKLNLRHLMPFDFNSNPCELEGSQVSFNVDKSNGVIVKAYKNQLKELSCSYEPDRGALILATPLLALDSYLKTKETDFSLRDVTEQRLNFVLKSGGNVINMKSDSGYDNNKFHVNLDGLNSVLSVRGDRVMSSNINMNIRGRDNYVEATVISEDQNKASMFTVDQLRGKSSMSNT